MANKTANVIARVAPDVKSQAESIMDQLGVPVSVVINMLYKQIILTQSIPFSLSIPTKEPVALDEMDRKTFDSMIDKGYQQAIRGESSRVAEAFEGIREKL
ncbi:MAG: type II toxin-antitoxin system RelB/DinJ family antitoxin [Firmicutes bacterium]|nr:type II toxin-antitoxin system RelB/DinJ family antitoxin [Bacillota bacterium]